MTSSGTLIVIGGDNMEYANSVEYYNPEVDEWTKLMDLTVNRTGYTSSMLGGKLILVGGTYEGIVTSIVQSYDFPSGTLAPLSPCNGTRYGHVAAVVQNRLYVFGGYDGLYLNTVESYDPDADTWTNLPPMQTIRSTPGVAVFNDEVYIFGGYSFAEKELGSVESYNPASGTWKYCSPMNEIRDDPAVATVGNLIYVVAGRSENTVLNSVEVYDPVTDQWNYLHDSYIRRRRCEGYFFNDSLFVAGGEDFSSILVQSVETYDIKNDTWTIKNSLIRPRTKFSLVEVPWTAIMQTLALKKK